MSKTVCVIAAHPDDEVLGCGGAIAKHIQQGDDVHVLIMSEGITSRDQDRNVEKRSDELSDLVSAAQEANKILGSTSLAFSQFPDNRMDSVDLLDVVKVVEGFFNDKNPKIVYTHHFSDVNIDHQTVHNAVVTAARPLPGSQLESVLFFEVLSSTEWQVAGNQKYFQPNWFVDISDTVNKKCDAMKVYNTELREWPHPRSVRGLEALASLRGCTIGVDAAEAFVLGRKII